MLNLHNYLYKRNRLVLFSLLSIGLIIRLYIFVVHHITPDEAWHLADALFFANGKIPLVDYASRQPLYVFLIGIFIKVFGASYLTGRLLLLLTSLGTLLFIYLIAQIWFDKKIALLSLATYICFPFVFIWEPIIQEQGLVIFFNCAAIYFASFSIFKKQYKPFLFLSGILFACAYYSRQTGLASIIALFLFLLFFEKFKIMKIFRKYHMLALGFLTLPGLFFAFYLQYMSIGDILNTNINPLYLVVVSLKNIITHTASYNPIGQNNFNLALQDSLTTKRLLHATLRYNYVLVVSYLVLLALVFLQIVWIKQRNRNEFHKMLFFVFWPSITALFYGYHYFHRGFFPQYIREFQIPLVMVFGFLVFYLARKSVEDDMILGWIVFMFGVTVGSWLLYCFIITSHPSMIYTVLLSGLFLTLVASFKLSRKHGGIQIPQFEKCLYWSFLVLLTGTFIYTFSLSGRLLSIHYQSLWSPKMINKVVSVIKRNSSESDGVLAGSPIWAIQSGRRIIPAYAHPMTLKLGVSPETNRDILESVLNDPPRIVVVDWFTREIYFDCFPWIKKMVDNSYLLQATYSELDYETIEVYKLNKGVCNKITP